MKKLIIIFILCVSTKSFSQLVSNSRNGNVSTIKKENNSFTVDSIQKNIIVLSSSRFAKPVIINKMDTINGNKAISEKNKPKLLTTKRKQD